MANDSRLNALSFTVTVATLTALLLFPAAASSADKEFSSVPPQPVLNLHFACRADNDLYRVMTADGSKYARNVVGQSAGKEVAFVY